MLQDLKIKDPKTIFYSNVAHARTLEEVNEGITLSLNLMRKISNPLLNKSGYVSGALTADGPNLVNKNFELLKKYTHHIRASYDFPLFSLTDIFDDELTLKFKHVPQQNWQLFWRKVLSNGLITDVFMTPRWRISPGANDEYKFSKSIGLRIHNFEDSPHLLNILREN